jgi:hypothetical protein
MILLDFSQVALNSIQGVLSDELSNPNDDSADMIRHTIFNALLKYKSQFKEYGEFIICCDSKPYWRKSIFPHYKGDRKLAKEKSKLDYSFIYKVLDEFLIELRDNFKWKIITTKGAEADDIIAVLCKYSQTELLVQDGIFESSPQPIMIISSDHDFFQLQKYKNVKQFSPIMGKLVKPDCSISEYLITHIVKASDDNIPSIMNADSWAAARCLGASIRAKPVTKAILERYISGGGRAACLDDFERSNWDRNEMLIDLDKIPKKIEDSILSAYIEYEVRGTRNKIMTYLTKHRFKQLFSRLSEF